MNDFPYYAALEHLERIADALEYQNAMLEPEKDYVRQPEHQADQVRHLSLFLEGLPTRNYNGLRQKLIPANTTAKILGISPAQLACLDRHNFIKGKGGRYDVLSILEWLDSDYNPDTEALNAQ